MCCLISATLAVLVAGGDFSWEKAKELGKEVSGHCPSSAEAVLGYTGMHREPSWQVEGETRLVPWG